MLAAAKLIVQSSDSRSASPIDSRCTKASAKNMTPRWLCVTPLGEPVDPDV